MNDSKDKFAAWHIPLLIFLVLALLVYVQLEHRIAQHKADAAPRATLTNENLAETAYAHLGPRWASVPNVPGPDATLGWDEDNTNAVNFRFYGLTVDFTRDELDNYVTVVIRSYARTNGQVSVIVR